ncbi:LysE family transporter [Caenispirillum bisanense]|uniref:Chemosensory pili system protein ChpE n=1 Tax=Caenispirillum bisanense TaxID=414052 RepID=A0A286G456_9PROT|nr:LysE family transporter [Caenispirillum bisanense]SOD90268.1 chemosensory pili system protein ChpE [Caenispirillum bisanense]
MLSLFAAAFWLGLAFNAPPGAVTAETLRRGLARGFGPAFAVQVGSLIGDAAWAVVGLTGAGILMQVGAVKAVLGAAGVALLAWLGLQALRDALRGGLPEADPDASPRGDFLAGAALSLTNPFAAAYWMALGGVLVALGVERPEAAHYGVFFAGFMASSVLWCFVAAGVTAWGRRLLTPGLYRAVNAVCGLGLMTMAALLGVDAWA